MAIFLPENQALGNNAYEMPKNLKLHLAKSFIANSQYSQNPGYKKALHLCDPSYNDRSKSSKTQGKKGVPYSSLKKIKHNFQYTDPRSLEYTLMGGEEMKNWVNDTLNRERTKVQPELQRKKSESLKNSSKPAKLTTKPLKSGDVEVNLKEDKKTIYLTEEQIAKIKNHLNERFETIKGFDDVELDGAPSEIILKGYKLVRLYPNLSKLKDAGYSKEEIENIKQTVSNKVFPPYFLNNGWELGKWYRAGMQDITVEINDETEEIVNMRASGRNSKGTKMPLSPNIGMHALELPLAYDNAQGDKANGNGYMPNDLVWAEIYINFEAYDKQEYTRRLGTIKSKEMYPTLKQASQDKKPFYKGGFKKGMNGKGFGQFPVTVYLSSEFMFKRLLTQEEVEQICNENGVKAINHELALDLNHYFPNDSWKGN